MNKSYFIKIFIGILLSVSMAFAGSIFTYSSGIYNSRSGKVTLAWTIENTSNNIKEFEIKRSMDGSSFNIISVIPFSTGIDNSFEFIDNEIFRSLPKPSSTVFYYRIDAKDSNGNTIESLNQPVGVIAGIGSTWGSIKALFR
ncbi:MAG: hypothetical protein DWQ06_07035 [Calditrichaeota bacterium]|nr:MAG: hypothetical protein DWQ06_07035 [Calditrichota bacterium]